MNCNKCDNENGKAIAALVLGIVGMLAWIIPIVGLPIGIIGLIMGILSVTKSGNGMAIAGIVLSIICLVLTIINASIGAYQGYHGTAWFQQTESKGANESVDENTKESTDETVDDVVEETTDTSTKENVFAVKDADGNILMTGGIEKAEAKMSKQSDGEVVAVEIVFTDEGAKQFATITEAHTNERVEMYVNDTMIFSAQIFAPITDGVCQITMNSLEEAEKIAEQLNHTK